MSSTGPYSQQWHNGLVQPGVNTGSGLNPLNRDRQTDCAVRVLILAWAQTDLPSTENEIDQVHRLFGANGFGYSISRYNIPEEQSAACVQERLRAFFDTMDEDKKAIVYYKGHGGINRVGGNYLAFASQRTPKIANGEQLGLFRWDLMRNCIAAAKPEVLTILDCCHAGAANWDEALPHPAITQTPAGKYLIAACSFSALSYTTIFSGAMCAAVFEMLQWRKYTAINCLDIHREICRHLQLVNEEVDGQMISQSAVCYKLSYEQSAVMELPVLNAEYQPPQTVAPPAEMPVWNQGNAHQQSIPSAMYTSPAQMLQAWPSRR